MDASVQQSSLGARLASWLPRGDSLDAQAFKDRHRTLSILLALHVPALLAFGILRGHGVLHSIGEVAPAAALLALAQLGAVPRRIKGILVSAGLVWCSAVAVHLSGGMIEAHFHFFVILAFIALYQDWAAFGWTIVFTALSHGAASAISPDLMFNHASAIQQPWTWALIHAAMVLFAATGQVIGWRHAELTQHRATELSTALLREQADRQASYARIYVNLARRNQSLLHRQLSVIDELEQHEEDPDTLRRLFALDHLTTRVRRNAESLLVVAGEESPRRWSTAVALADIARAAASEIEQYERTDVRVPDDVAITGSAVVDITHLLAELIENAAEYSSPETTVVVTGGHQGDGAVLMVEDLGIGMGEQDLVAANEVLAAPPELDEQQVRQLGFQVVGRLAQKLAIKVRLRPTVGGSGPRAGAGRKGITAVVEIPRAILADGGMSPSAPTSPELAAPTVQHAPTEDQAPVSDTAEVTPLERRHASHDIETPTASDIAPPALVDSEPVAVADPDPAPPIAETAQPPLASPPPPPTMAPPTPQISLPATRPASGFSTSPAVPEPAPEPEPEYTPPPAVTIPARPQPAAPSPSGDVRSDAGAPAPPSAPTVPRPPADAAPLPGQPATDGSGSTLFLAKQPPSTSVLSRKGRKARREQQRHTEPAPAPTPQTAHPAPPDAPSAPKPAVTATPPSNDDAPTTGGSTIDDIDQLAQYASRLPQRTPGGSLAPGLREPQPEPEATEPSGSSPEARQALSAFQSAARSARRPAEESMEHPS